MKKRIMAMLLALCMVLSICVPIAVADDEQPEEKAVVPECSCWGASLGLPLSSHGIINNCDRQNFCKEEINTTVSHMVYNWADYPDDVKTYLVELLTGDEAYAEKYAELQKELKLEDNRPQITVEDKSPTVGGYKPSVSVEGQTVRMDKYAKATLSAGADTTWQICIDPTDIWQWADITGGQGSLTVSYGLIGSLLTEKNGEHQAYLRACRTYEDGEAQLRAYSKIYTIVMDLSEPDLSESQSLPTPDFEEMTPSDAAPASTEEPAPASTEEPAPAATETDSAAAGANAVTPASLSETGAETGDVIEPSVTTTEPKFIQPVPAFPQADEQDEQEKFVILINYVFKEDGSQAASQWKASIAKGGSFQLKVSSPAVVGYTPDQAEVDINLTDIQENTTYTVTYWPAEVDFTVKHYQQNIADDKYTLVDTETKTGLTKSAVGEALAKTYDGFYALLYDTTTEIAADGSTVVEIYYDRYYYLMNFALDGGYGVESIYAKYGTEISIGEPTKPGYTFEGWDKEIPASMPAGNTTFKANWTPGESGFTVVFWYENADDAEYSFAGSYKPKNVESGTKVSSDNYRNQNFDGRDNAHFTYNEDKAETVTVAGDGSTILNVYFTRNTYTLTFKDGNIKIVCGKVEHEHSHEQCCTKTGWHLSCNSNKCPVGYEHEHTASCYKTSDLTITAKYEADIHSNFPIKDGGETIWWEVPSNCKSFKPGTTLGSIDTMPGENITFTRDSSTSAADIYYYLEVLNGEQGTYTQGGKSFKLYKTINISRSGYLTYTEEFHDIKGFTQWWSDPAFNKHSQGGRTDGINSKNYLCYTRNSYNLKFYNYNAEVSGKGGSVQYEAPLSGYQFTPEYPSDLEKNAYEFAGWYTTAECFDGTEVNWETAKMPANDVMLYAKWMPKTHTVRTWLTNKLDTPVNVMDGNEQKILHGRKAVEPAQPKNGNYTFVGWFYEEDGVEHAFDFSMPITKDLDLYAKWSSNTLVNYTIRYVLKDSRTEIAAPTTGSALAGSTKTFNAKAGSELYDQYQSGYFPLTNSHSLTMDIEGSNEYIFEYTQVDRVKYTVRYLDKATGEPVVVNGESTPDKTVETTDAVITEKFKQIAGYAPDAYQKRLVLSANENENVIIFWYTKDTEHAPVQIIHWVQSISTGSYTEYQSSTNVNGTIGETYTADPLTIAGYTYTANPAHPVDGYPAQASGVLTAEGLVLNLYYNRNSYPVEVRYLEQGTDKVLRKPDQNRVPFGTRLMFSPWNIPGYTPVDSRTQYLTVQIEEGDQAVKNVVTFYYTEQTVNIKYVIVGPDDCGGLDNYQESELKAVTGEPKGSTPTAAPGFKFVGWYIDKDCVTRVDGVIPNAVDSETNKLTPQKRESGEHYTETYYAKFEPDVFTLIITKSGADPIDENQTFIFLIEGSNSDPVTKGFKMEVVVHMDRISGSQAYGAALVSGLKVGNYTVSEVTDWSWRYTPNNGVYKKPITRLQLERQKTIMLDFYNDRTNSKWLNGAAYCDNRWISKTAINSATSATVEIN